MSEEFKFGQTVIRDGKPSVFCGFARAETPDVVSYDTGQAIVFEDGQTNCETVAIGEVTVPPPPPVEPEAPQEPPP